MKSAGALFLRNHISRAEHDLLKAGWVRCLREQPNLRGVRLEFNEPLGNRKDLARLSQHYSNAESRKLAQVAEPAEVQPTAQEERNLPLRALNRHTRVQSDAQQCARKDLRGRRSVDFYPVYFISRKH